MDEELKGQPNAVSRRSFIKGASAGIAGASVLAGTAVVESEQPAEAAPAAAPATKAGPGPVNVTLNLNGTNHTVQVEPRTTLVNVLRGVGHRPLPPDQALTGAKVGCDRGSCGACTVLVDGKAVYSCMMLAIDAQGRKISTSEGLVKGGQLSPVQQEMVRCDGYQCGYCTPGMVMSITGLLNENPNPTLDDVKMAVSGNICRCGTYPRIFEAALAAAKKKGA